ncbi:hypothetical protein [Comamonas testosteroni]|uniref:hypothetical protein n=1 Tax=Comamonas testosteroni TaxID=285 RepID=UPI002E0EDBEC|nr:hypothetical protein U0024_15000 [Comamonas testosteroni]
MKLFRQYITIGLLAWGVSFTAQAQSTRLAVIIGEPFRDSGSSCSLKRSQDIASAVPSGGTLINETDVVAWDARYGRFTLDPGRYPASALDSLEKRCFVLLVDGGFVGDGVTLSVKTSTLTGLNTLNLIPEGDKLTIQFTTGNHGAHLRLLWPKALRTALGQSYE